MPSADRRPARARSLPARRARVLLDESTDTPSALAFIEARLAAGAGLVVLAGAEPTARADLGTLARRVLRRGAALGLETDGRRLHSAGALGNAVERLGLRSLRVLAASEQVALAVSRGALDLALEPLVVVCPDGADPRSLAEALDQGAPWIGEGFPRCVLPQHRSAEGPGDPVERILPPECAGCVWHGLCPGVGVESYRRHGPGPLEPVIGSVSTLGSVRGVPVGADPEAAPGGYRPRESTRLDISPLYPDTALVTLMVPGCDLACIFCEAPQGDLPFAPSRLEGVQAALEALAGRATGIYFTGGEPTRLVWLDEALRSARELGYERIQMQTHCGPAAEPERADRLIAAGLSGVDVPLYGPEAAIHEAITATPGSFERSLAGLAALRERGATSVLHVTLFRSNLPHLEATLRRIEELGPEAAYLQVTGDVGLPGTYARVAPDPRHAGRAIARALDTVGPSVPITISDLAPCHLPDRVESVSQHGAAAPRIGADPIVLPYGEWLMTFSAGGARAKAPGCEGCALVERCDGLPLEALATFGPGVVEPLP